MQQEPDIPSQQQKRQMNSHIEEMGNWGKVIPEKNESMAIPVIYVLATKQGGAPRWSLETHELQRQRAHPTLGTRMRQCLRGRAGHKAMSSSQQALQSTLSNILSCAVR